MRFLAITLIVHAPDPVTGVKKATAARFREVVDNARLAEELGFDGFGVGERHERPFISSSPPVVLSHLAALTSRIRLFTAVTTLSLLDPVRAYEDYATLDHLSGGRLELIIGKGNGAAQRELFHVTPADQWDRNAESYEVFRQLWRQDKVTADTRFRPPLTDAEVWPRPLQRPIRVWHGSATSRESVDLAARYGDPLFSANVTNVIEPYAELIRYYRERWAFHGHDPAQAAVGAGTAGYYSERNSQDAIEAYRPVFAGYLNAQKRMGIEPVFGTLEDFVERSSALIGSPQQIIDKVHRYHEQFGAHRPAPARRRERADRAAAPGRAGAVPGRDRAGAAACHPRPAVGLGTRPARPRRHGCGRRGPGRDRPAAHRLIRRRRMTSTPLTVLDLVPISTGSTAAEALRNSIDLAQQAERLGYTRYWFAEHHLNPGVAGTSPAVVLALTAGATSTIRLGSGAVQMGHRTALSTVEEFGLLDALHPGRFDLGLGRSGGKPPAVGTTAATPPGRRPNGLLIPPRFSYATLLGSPRFALQRTLLTLPDARPQDYTEQVADVLSLLAGTYKSAEGEEAHVVPGEGAALQVWILGSSGGESAQVAGSSGLRFAANYHVSPATVLEAVEGYRDAFVPSAELGRPYVSVSADVVVAESTPAARDLAAGFGPWVRSIRTAEGAIQFPTPDQARAYPWSDIDRELVADRVDTQFVGTAREVADDLERLRDATSADELIITTITHDHSDRVRSYQLLAEEWSRR